MDFEDTDNDLILLLINNSKFNQDQEKGESFNLKTMNSAGLIVEKQLR